MRDSKEVFFQSNKDGWLCVWYFPEEECLRVYFNGYEVDSMRITEEKEQSRLQYIIDRDGNRVEV